MSAKLTPLEAAQLGPAPIVEEVVGIKDRVAQKLIRASVELVRPRFEDDIENAPEAATELGRVGRPHDLELLDGVDRRKDRDARKAIDRREGGGHPVDDGIHHRRAGTVDRVAHRIVVVPDAPRDPWGQIDQRVDVSGIEGQVKNPAVVDDLAEHGVGGLKDRGLGRHLDRLTDRSHLQRKIDLEYLLDLENDPRAHGTTEPFHLRLDPILPDPQGWREIAPFPIRRQRHNSARLRLGDRHLCVRNHFSIRIADRPGDPSRERLAPDHSTNPTKQDQTRYIPSYLLFHFAWTPENFYLWIRMLVLFRSPDQLPSGQPAPVGDWSHSVHPDWLHGGTECGHCWQDRDGCQSDGLIQY